MMKLQHFIICDDVRLEVSGKHTLVGVYDDLVFSYYQGAEPAPAYPIITKLVFFIKLLKDETALDVDHYDFCITQEGVYDKNPLFTQPIPKPIAQNKITLVLTIGQFSIFREGPIDFSLNFYKGQDIVETVELGSIQVHRKVARQ
jgi:hypothetical protein